MSDGHHAHVENQVWLRAFLFAAVLVTIGVVAYGVLSVGLATGAHHAWEDALAEANGDTHDHHVIDAHLQFLTWNVAGNTILFMMIVYASFIGLAGLMNSSKAQADHGHDDHGHHGSASPIIMAVGVMLFMMGFPSFATAAEDFLYNGGGAFGEMLLSLVGLSVVMAGVANWWGEDLPFDGHAEQRSTASDDMVPFRGQHVRKVGIWIFLMSEVMVFGSFFSSYLRMRTGWCTEWALDAGRCTGETVVTASDLLRHDIATLLPGAINTFALIISSYTIVLALKTAKAKEWTPKEGLMGKLMPSQRIAVRNYLIATLMLGSMFIVLKLIEWSHLIAEGFTLQSQQGSIFYIATGAHGLHVFLGLIVMLYMVFKADLDPEVHGTGWTTDNAQGIEYFGLYWHFVDLAWVVIFPAFYLY